MISNPSFSDVIQKSDTTKFYELLPGNRSEVKDWYLPDYINYKLNEQSYLSLYRHTRYYSARDKNLIPKDRKLHKGVKTNGEQLFENNLGFVDIYTNELMTPPIIQQKFPFTLKKGKYCLKFKYKFIRYNSSYRRPPSLDILLSSTDLREYYTEDAILAPDSIVKVRLSDTINDTDENSPWQQKCYNIELSGNENFISIGSLRNKDSYPWGTFYVDDVELAAMDNKYICECKQIQKKLADQFKRNFPLDTVLINDTLVMFTPFFDLGANIVSPDAKL